MISKKQVINQIKHAFQDVKLGNGIGLWEGQAIDDYRSDEVVRNFSQCDEKEDWMAIPYADLSRCYSSLSFFDTDGMRFHLPAFILAELSGHESNSDPVFNLTSGSSSRSCMDSRFSSFSQAQREAITSYLRWCLQDEMAHNKKSILRALDRYWDPE